MASNGAPRGVTVQEVFDTVLETANGSSDGTTSVGEILDAFGSRAYGPVLFLIGAIMVTPLGAIPGAPLFAVVLVVLLMGQSVFRKGAPWIPARIRNANVDTEKLKSGLKKIKPWFKWPARVTKPRLTALFTPVTEKVLAICCIAVALTMIPLGFIPFAVAVPSLALAVIGLGWMIYDGLWVLVGASVAASGLAMLGTMAI